MKSQKRGRVQLTTSGERCFLQTCFLPTPFLPTCFLPTYFSHPASQTVSSQHASSQPSFPQPDYTEPASSQPSFPQPDYTEPASSQPSFPLPDYPEPASSHPSFPQPDYPEPASSHPSFPQPDYTEPASSHPSFPQPDYPEPASSQPYISQPASLPPSPPIPFAPSHPTAMQINEMATKSYPKLINEMATKSHPNLVRLLGYCFDMGTPGYVDPAYYRSHKATPKADVHSFGVVMLAVITARKAIYNIESNQAASLVAPGDVAALKDPHLQAPDDLVLRMARLALTCTAMPTASRPGMSRVLAELLLLKEEFFGEDEDRMAVRIDHEIESSEQVDFSLELARLQGVQHGS
ncbi:unnamed protein product [Closterium sp. NIES-64]|nr:unnamed protein product [Closterium sp. NIES-64]